MEDSNELSLTQDAGFLLSRASGVVARRAHAALTRHGLRIRQYSVLSLAADAPGGISQRDLAAMLGLDPSQVVLLVDELAAAGLVERRPSESDRRTRLVVATAAGRRTRRAAARDADDRVQDQLRALTDDEQDLLKALLTRIVASPGE